MAVTKAIFNVPAEVDITTFTGEERQDFLDAKTQEDMHMVVEAGLGLSTENFLDEDILNNIANMLLAGKEVAGASVERAFEKHFDAASAALGWSIDHMVDEDTEYLYYVLSRNGIGQ